MMNDERGLHFGILEGGRRVRRFSGFCRRQGHWRSWDADFWNCGTRKVNTIHCSKNQTFWSTSRRETLCLRCLPIDEVPKLVEFTTCQSRSKFSKSHGMFDHKLRAENKGQRSILRVVSEGVSCSQGVDVENPRVFAKASSFTRRRQVVAPLQGSGFRIRGYRDGPSC